MQRNNPNKGGSVSVNEQVEKHYWIEQDTLYHETFSKMTRVVYHAKIRKDGTLSIGWSIDEVILILCAIALAVLALFIGQWILMALVLLVLLVVFFMLMAENYNMRNTYDKAKDRIYRVSNADKHLKN